MTSNFIVFLKILYYIFSAFLILISGYLTLVILVLIGFSGGGIGNILGVDILGFLISSISILFTIYSIIKVTKSKDGKMIIKYTLILLALITVVILFFINFEQINKILENL